MFGGWAYGQEYYGDGLPSGDPSGSESAVLAESLSLTGSLSDSDSGSLTESPALAGSPSDSDSGAVTDSVQIGLAQSDSGTFSEATSIVRLIQEHGVFSEHVSIVVTLSDHDLGTDPPTTSIFRDVVGTSSRDLGLPAPPTPLFLINGNVNTPIPNEIAWIPMPEVGAFISGRPARQGRPSVVVTWARLSYDQMTMLAGLWNPSSPVVTLTLPSPRSNSWISYTATMSRPEANTRETFSFLQVSCQFSWLVPTGSFIYLQNTLPNYP